MKSEFSAANPCVYLLILEVFRFDTNANIDGFVSNDGNDGDDDEDEARKNSGNIQQHTQVNVSERGSALRFRAAGGTFAQPHGHFVTQNSLVRSVIKGHY